MRAPAAMLCCPVSPLLRVRFPLSAAFSGFCCARSCVRACACVLASESALSACARPFPCCSCNLPSLPVPITPCCVVRGHVLATPLVTLVSPLWSVRAPRPPRVITCCSCSRKCFCRCRAKATLAAALALSVLYASIRVCAVAVYHLVPCSLLSGCTSFPVAVTPTRVCVCVCVVVLFTRSARFCALPCPM